MRNLTDEIIVSRKYETARKKITIDCSNLPAGIYITQATGENKHGEQNSLRNNRMVG